MGRSSDYEILPLQSEDLDAPTRAVSDQALSGRITLDNRSFERCVFRRALLVYAGGAPPQIRDCRFDEVAFEFSDAAGRTLAFLQAMAQPSSGLRDIVKASFPKIFAH